MRITFGMCLVAAVSLLTSACGVSDVTYETSEVSGLEQGLKSCYSEAHGNAEHLCYCDRPRHDPVLVNTSDCLPGSANYNNYGSTAACLEAFDKACKGGTWMPGNTMPATSTSSSTRNRTE